MSEFVRDDSRYIVLKYTDIEEAFTETEISILYELLDKYDVYRTIHTDKGFLHTVVVEKDWPMYEDVWKMIEEWSKKDE